MLWRYLKKNAAILLKESEASEKFEFVFTELLHSEEKQRKLSANITKLAKPNATREIVEEIEKLTEKYCRRISIKYTLYTLSASAGSG